MTAAQTVKTKNALWSIWPSPGCRHIYVSYSVVTRCFHYIDTACSFLIHLLFSVFHKHVGILKVTHTKTCVDHHIQSIKYMHLLKVKKEEGDNVMYIVSGFGVQSHCLRGSYSGTCTGE